MYFALVILLLEFCFYSCCIVCLKLPDRALAQGILVPGNPFDNVGPATQKAQSPYDFTDSVDTDAIAMAASQPESTDVSILEINDDREVFDEFLLHEHLPLYPKKKPLFKVIVTAKYLSMEPTELIKRSPIKARSIKARRQSYKKKRSSSQQSINDDLSLCETRQTVINKGGIFLCFDDVIGCDCMKGKTDDDTCAYVTMYAYPKKKKIGSKRTIRKRETLTLMFNNCDTYEDNMKEAQKWMTVMQCLAKRVHIENIPDLSKLHISVPRKMLVVINPFGGQGKALQIFKQRIVPILAEASISFDMKVTEYAGHAREMMTTVGTSAWYGILIVSGDGLVHEVVNGLMDRPDWVEAIKIPLGILPCGSGNALSSAISFYTGEPYLDNHVMHASYAIAKHKVIPMDLVAIDTCQGKRLYSFLSCAFGLMADADIESEKYRAMGNARFTFGAMIRILGLRKYRGKISFLPFEDYVPPSPNKKSLTRAKSVVEEKPDHPQLTARSASVIEEPITSVHPSEGESASVDNELDGGIKNMHIGSMGDTHNGVENLEKVEFNEEPLKNVMNNSSGNRRSTGDAPCSAIETPYLVPLDEPVPSDWVTIEGEYVNVAAIYQSHLGKDIIAVPSGKPNDGIIHLNITKSSITRMKLVALFSSMQEGKFTCTPDSEMIKVKAFRFEPEDNNGIMTCDGEKFPYGPIQGQILPSVANIMVLK